MQARIETPFPAPHPTPPPMTWPAPFDVLGAGRMKRPYHRYRYALLMAITRQKR